MEQLFGQQHPREDDDGDRLSVDAGLSDWQRSGRFLLFFTESVIQSLYIGQCATKASKINWPSAVWLSAYDIASLREVIKLYSFNFIVWPENIQRLSSRPILFLFCFNWRWCLLVSNAQKTKYFGLLAGPFKTKPKTLFERFANKPFNLVKKKQF